MFMKAGNTCVVKNVHINRCSHIFDENSKNKRIKIFKALKMTHCEIEKLGVSTELLSVSLYAANEVYLEKVSKTNKDYCQIIENKFQYIEDEIDIRFESIYIQLDQYEMSLLEKLEHEMRYRLNDKDSMLVGDEIAHDNSKHIYKIKQKRIKKGHVGLLVHPFQRYENIKKINSYHIPSYSTDSMIYIAKKKQAVLIDIIEKSFKIVDKEGKFIETIYLKNYFRRPKSLCFNEVTDEIFVADTDASKVLVFSSTNYSFLRCFRDVYKPRGIAVDSKKSHLIVGSSRDYQDILVLDCQTGGLIKRVNLTYSVNCIKSINDYLVLGIFKGFVIVDKSTYEVVKIVDTHYNLEFFELIDNQFVLTINTEQNMMNTLCLMDFSGKIISKTKIKIDFEISDICLIGQRLILNSGFYHPSIHVIDFD